MLSSKSESIPSSINEFNSTNTLKKGHWKREENRLYFEAIEKYGKKWIKVNFNLFIMQISNHVKTRNSAQVRSHTQKYVHKYCLKLKLCPIKFNDTNVNEFIEKLSDDDKVQKEGKLLLKNFKSYIPWKLLFTKEKVNKGIDVLNSSQYFFNFHTNVGKLKYLNSELYCCFDIYFDIISTGKPNNIIVKTDSLSIIQANMQINYVQLGLLR